MVKNSGIGRIGQLLDCRLLGTNRLSLVYAVPIPIAITQPVIWIVRPEAQARPDLSRARKRRTPERYAISRCRSRPGSSIEPGRKNA
jgi:hypothetical protein